MYLKHAVARRIRLLKNWFATCGQVRLTVDKFPLMYKNPYRRLGRALPQIKIAIGFDGVTDWVSWSTGAGAGYTGSG
jgi:hypothetical protein